MATRARLHTGLLALLSITLVATACEVDDGGEAEADDADDAAEVSVVDDPDPDERVPTLRYLGPGASWTPSVHDASLIFQETARELGVEVELATVPDFATFAGEVDETDQWDLALAGVVARPERIDPDPLLSPFWDPDGATNFSGYESEEMAELVEAQRTELDVEARQELVSEVQHLLAEDLPMVTWFYPHSGHVYNHRRFGDPVLQGTEGYWNIFNHTTTRPLTDDEMLRIGIMAPIPTLNPLAFDEYATHVDAARWIFDSLARIGGDGEPRPWMAEEWEVLDDNAVRVHLRDDLLFHDDTPVTAEDVAFSYEYVAEWQPAVMADAVAAVDGVEVVDELTADIILTEPFAPLFVTTLSAVPILPKHLWEGQVEELGLSHPREWEDAPMVGSGPFQFVHVRPREELLLDAFPDHFEPPEAEGMLVRVFSDPEGLFRAFQAEEVFFTESTLRMTPRHLERIEEELSDFLEVTWAPTITARWMHFNMREGHPTADLALRRALAHTIDYDLMVIDVLEERGDLGAGPIAPVNEFWHEPDVDWPRFNPERAREILAEAGYRWDQDGTLYYPEGFQP